MLKIEINEETHNASEMVDLLSVIAERVEEGCTSGFGPDWSLEGEEEEREDDEE